MRVVIVDGYSTGRVLSQRLSERGVSCIHVQSQRESHPYYRKSFRPGDYTTDLGYAEDPAELAAELTRWNVDRVVPGTESGVLLADVLNGLLGLPGNDEESATASTDKALMSRLARKAGIPVPLGGAFSSAAECVRWYRAQGLVNVVAKPVASAGSDGVRFCHDEAALLAASEEILAGVNVYGEPNTQVVVQERVSGPEYFVDTISHRGTHKVAELWRYHKRVNGEGVPLYDYQEPVLPASDEWKELKEFTHHVLDGLGIAFGPAHTEIMLTDAGPVLVETGARLGGGTLPEVVERYSGRSQTSVYVEGLLDPAYLHDFDDEAVRWTHQVRFVDLHSHGCGEVKSMRWRAWIESLPTIAGLATGLRPGDLVEPTVSLLNSPGYLYLAATAKEAIVRDYDALRSQEAKGLYTRQ
jgi:biotin carboxylase